MSNILSIEIGNDTIKLCEISKNGKSIAVKKAIHLVTPDMSVQDGYIRSLTKIEQLLKGAMSQNNIKTKNAIFTIIPGRIMTKEVTIPFIKEQSKILDVIFSNAREYFPIDTSDCVYSYTLLNTFLEEKVKKMHIMAYAVPNEIVQSIYDLAKVLKLKILSVDYLGNSIFQFSKEYSNISNTMCIQMNDDNTLVNVFIKGELVLQRNINYGLKELIHNVSKNFGINTIEAIDKLNKDDLLKDDTFEIVPDEINMLISNVARVKEYFRNKFKNDTIDNIEILGAGADFKGINSLFFHALNQEVVSNNNISNIKNMSNVKNISLYMDVIAATIKPAGIIPKNIQEYNRKRVQSAAYRTIILGALLIGVIIVTIPSIEYFKVAMDKISIQSELDSLSSIDDIVDAYNKAEDKNNDVNNINQNSMVDYKNVIALVKYLKKANVKDAKVTSAQVSETTVTLVAEAKDKASSANLLKAVSDSKIVTNPAITSYTDDGVTVLFTIAGNVLLTPDEGSEVKNE